MDFKTFVTERLASITAQLNAIGTNAKKTEELPLQTTLDPASLIRVSHGGISKGIEIQKIIDSIKNNTYNQLLSIGQITLVGNVVTVPIDASWKINEIIYNTSIDTIITVPFAGSGLTRTDILVANTSGQIVLVQGTETSGIAARPNIPIDTVLVTEMVVTNTLVGDPLYPEIIDNYVLKVEGYSLTKNDLTDILKGSYDGAVAWIIANESSLLAHLADTNNPHSVTKSQVGLGNVENTSDLDKPVSTAQATADNAILTSANSYSDGLITQLINGAPADANTLKELNDKILAVQAIIGSSSADGDSIVNTVSELLAVFATFPEGIDLVTLLSGKVNVTDIYNALDCIIAGKVLDARQGKVLNDAITAINVSLALKANNSEVVHLLGAETITGLKTFSGPLTAGSFVKSGGTASQFLKADGSVDSNTYLTSAVTTFSGGTTGLTPSVASFGAIVLAGTLVLANGGTGATTASGARTNLGATTIGSNLFTATNPSAVTFLRTNADNTISWLDAVSFRTAIGAGTSTVTPSALTKVDDTNVTLTLGGTPATSLLQGVSLTLGWTGTLADSRIASAATWNAKQAALSGTGFVKSTAGVISYDTSTYLTSISGITAGGELSGTYPNPTLLNSAVIGKVLTGVNITGGSVSATDSILTAFGKLQNQINALIGGSIYQSVWNASTNSPALTTSVGTKGYYYIVSVAGNTNLNGITDWKVGDWAIYDGTSWQKVDNTDAVSSVNGFTGSVSLTTANVTENTNLYYTDSRSRNAISLTNTGNSGASTYSSATGVFNIPTYTLAGLGGQPLDADLTAIAALAGTSGLLKKTATDTWTLDTSTYLTSVTPSNFASQTANTVLAAPNGSAGVPTFRAIVAADIPTLNQNTTGQSGSVAQALTITTGNGLNGTVASYNGSVAVTISHLNTDGNLHVPATSTTNNGKFLMAGATAGSLSWGTPPDTNTTYTSSNGILLTGTNFTPTYGTTVNTITQGNDSRLSDARTPLAHNQAWSTITSTPTTLSGYGITDTPWTSYLPLSGGTITNTFESTYLSSGYASGTFRNKVSKSVGGKADYVQFVVLLHPAYNGTLIGFGECEGKFIRRRGSTSSGMSIGTYDVQTKTAYNVNSYGIRSSAGGNGTICTCTYGGVKYVAFKPDYVVQASEMSFDGYINGDANALLLVPYYNTNTSTVLNAEVNGSIVDITAASYNNNVFQGALNTTGNITAPTFVGNLNGYAELVQANPNRTDGTAYPVLWSNGNAQSPTYSCAAVTIQSSTGTLQATTLRATADVIAYYSSDKRFKDNITPISNALEKVKSLGGYEFDWNDTQETHTGHDIGLIAQEVELIFPEIVANRTDGYKSVKYERLIPVFVEAIKEQQVQIEELKSLVKALTANS